MGLLIISDIVSDLLYRFDGFLTLPIDRAIADADIIAPSPDVRSEGISGVADEGNYHFRLGSDATDYWLSDHQILDRVGIFKVPLNVLVHATISVGC